MKVSVIAAANIDSEMAAQWRHLQSENPMLANPNFCVEYTQAVARVRDDVFVGVMEEGNEIVGFFPFQQKKKRVAGPVGGRLSDYQGVIVAAGTPFDVEDLFDKCDLKIWDFDHLLVGQKPFESFHQSTHSSPVMDISEGFEAYVQARRQAGSKKIKQLNGQWRAFERNIGELRFELFSDQREVFSQVIEWKRQQCRRTGVVDFMDWGWTTGMLEQIWHKNSDEFAGMLSVLYHQDEIIAAHMGMRSKSVCHWWFPVYNDQYQKYSPGSLLLLKFANEVADQGMQLIDLGKGDAPYKHSFATGEIRVAEGSVLRPSLVTSLRRAQTLGKERLVRPAKQQLRTIRDFVISNRA